MHIDLTCKSCNHRWTVTSEPQALSPLACPACSTGTERRAAEDLASSLEDALCQLGLLGKALDIEVRLSSRELPAPFRL